MGGAIKAFSELDYMFTGLPSKPQILRISTLVLQVEITKCLNAFSEHCLTQLKEAWTPDPHSESTGLSLILFPIHYSWYNIY